MFYTSLTPEQLRRFHASLGELRALFGDGLFYGDQLITLGRNMGFLRDEKFTGTVMDESKMVADRAMIWRFHTLAWAASHAMHLPGDFVECGVYQGLSTRIIARYLDFATSDKSWLLYDLFDNPGGPGQGIALPGHGADLYRRVCESFVDFPTISVVQGRIPEILGATVPARIAFLHLDLNDAEAERAALTILFPRMVPGGLIVLDDYGWAAYAAQHDSANAFLAAHDHRVLELPTGQGLVIKH